ncbi:MAG: hypothetical protein OXI59_15910 [Gemmatimonadota bacterium]|nr:hypothetical protein [Gemmatimonadota bacterium]MYB55241.1 divalent-cation tolerance protein CutA [Gemmatimonadota bacterium]
MLKVWIVILFGFCFVASAKAEEENASRIAREMIRSLYGSERVKPLPPVANAQVRVIARRLVAESDERFQHAFFQAGDREQGAFFSGLMKHVIIGVMICLVFFVVHTVVRKLDVARRMGKTDRDVAVQGGLRNAPYILALPMPSEAEANRVGHALVAERLAARADVFSQYFLSPDRDGGTVLFVMTVKGRLRSLKKRLRNVSMSFPVSHGHRSYLTWIADAADGRG